jgi:hypothetical protein
MLDKHSIKFYGEEVFPEVFPQHFKVAKKLKPSF